AFSGSALFFWWMRCSLEVRRGHERSSLHRRCFSSVVRSRCSFCIARSVGARFFILGLHRFSSLHASSSHKDTCLALSSSHSIHRADAGCSRARSKRCEALNSSRSERCGGRPGNLRGFYRQARRGSIPTCFFLLATRRFVWVSARSSAAQSLLWWLPRSFCSSREFQARCSCA